jgi:Chitinase class I
MNNKLAVNFKADGKAETLRKGIVEQVNLIELAPHWKDIFTAYLLATVEWECASKWKPIEEYGKGKGRSYGPSGYYGRGFVQLTWKYNYELYTKILGLDLVNSPVLALRDSVALFILVHGSYYGMFTGIGFNDFPNPTEDSFDSMRRIINGKDKAAIISAKALKWLVYIEKLKETT